MEKPAPEKISKNDIALIQYTGGTTGVAKGAMLSHDNIISNVIQDVILVMEKFCGFMHNNKKQ